MSKEVDMIVDMVDMGLTWLQKKPPGWGLKTEPLRRADLQDFFAK